jgi:hypothetical protein
MLSTIRRFVERNFSIFGEHPQLLVLRGHQIDISEFFLHSASPLRIVPSSAPGSTQHPDQGHRRKGIATEGEVRGSAGGSWS